MDLSKPKEHVHYILHKPFGYLSQFMSNAKHERNKKFLGTLHDFQPGVMPIGRLDKNSEGLLLLTTDGFLSNEICSTHIEKEYYVQVDGAITAAAIAELQGSVNIGFKGIKYDTKPCKVFQLETPPDFSERSKKIRDARHGPTSWLSITINEGKFRQVRKMTSAVGFPTLRLVRIRIGTIHLNRMAPGEVIKLDELKVD
ncbi:pseudouridine synthase [Gelidibacter salicanalis]|uniref:Pseudouridine synthase n=1 Tax=Gelidibacter salicanalis TaxID=291193 RepID=A0A934KX39_9FLAO|nr:pseudouridine synthase [Gelidibacter salicanalis]MBJ7882468.1 pseudouridine synthase [Gelidibacter salicanalis]